MTPLALILANLDIAEAELGQNEWLEDIRAEGHRMTELVRKIKDPTCNRKEPIRNQVHIGFFGRSEHSTREHHLLCFGFILRRRFLLCC